LQYKNQFFVKIISDFNRHNLSLTFN